MCCFYSRKKTAELRAMMIAKGGTMTFYKAYARNKKTLRSLVYGNTSGGLISISGDIKSNRETKAPCKDALDGADGPSTIWRGIHVSITLANAKSYVADFGGRIGRVVKVTANVKDLVAAGDDMSDAVFMKVHISPAEFKKATKPIQRKKKPS